MKLEEAFEIYSDKDKLTRPGKTLSYDIKWLKGLHAWGNEESRKLGFIIPQSMIDDAKADDWEILQ